MQLVEAMRAVQEGRLAAQELDALYSGAIRDTIRRFEETGSPVITDGEQTKPSPALPPIPFTASMASRRMASWFLLPTVTHAACPG